MFILNHQEKNQNHGNRFYINLMYKVTFKRKTPSHLEVLRSMVYYHGNEYTHHASCRNELYIIIMIMNRQPIVSDKGDLFSPHSSRHHNLKSVSGLFEYDCFFDVIVF